MNTSFIQFDKAASYIPGVSTVVNLPEIIYKSFIINGLDQESFKSDPVDAYLSQKSLLRCIVLLIPVLGNLAILASDLIELARNSAEISPTPLNISIAEEINQMIEEEKAADIEFQESIQPIIEKGIEEGKLLQTKLKQANECIPSIMESADETEAQCNLVTKKIINYQEKDDSFTGKIIDLLALGVIVYTGWDLTVPGVCLSVAALKAWSFFRGS